MAKHNIDCEIKKVFEPKGGKIGISLKPLSEDPQIQSSRSYKQQYDNFTVSWWLNGQIPPEWIKEGIKIKLPYYLNNDYVNISQDDMVLVIEDNQPNEEDKSFEKTINELDEDVDNTDFNYGANTEPKQEQPIVKPVETPPLNDRESIMINKYVHRYQKILSHIDPGLELKKLDMNSKKDIATHISIILDRQD